MKKGSYKKAQEAQNRKTGSQLIDFFFEPMLFRG
jgi:hypothetical protein